MYDGGYKPNQLFTAAGTTTGGTIATAVAFACFFILDHMSDNQSNYTHQNCKYHTCAYDFFHNNHILSNLTFELLLLPLFPF
jgi:hypothetical protein